VTLRGAARAAAVLALALLPLTAESTDRLVVTWHPVRPRIGDISWVHVRGASDAAVIEGSVGTRPLAFFAYAGGHAALLGLDIDTKPGAHPWRLAVLEPGVDPHQLSGTVTVRPRAFPVQRLTVAPGLADPDPETERRAIAEGQQLQMLYRTISPERLWRGPFVRPIAGTEPPSGFGARRIINGRPRTPHGGADYSAPRGTPVVAATRAASRSWETTSSPAGWSPSTTGSGFIRSTSTSTRSPSQKATTSTAVRRWARSARRDGRRAHTCTSARR